MLRRPMFRMLAIAGIVILALAAYKAYSISQMIKVFKAPKPAISVSAAPVTETLWVSKTAAVGTLKAHQGVDLSVEVAGTVSTITFNSGQKVNQGDVLLTLDSKSEQASLATAEAALSLARIEHTRGSNLITRQAISKSEFDRLNAELKKAQAAVDQLRATLNKRTLRAPFSGTIGIHQVDVGAYIAAGTEVATLQDLHKLYVDFYLPEQYAPTLSLGQPIEVSVAAFADERFSAQITAINPKVDDNTRSILVRASLNNDGQKLLPGMFANLQILTSEPRPQLVIPETAVTFTLYGTSVYVVTEDPEDQSVLRAQKRFLKTGERREGKVVVLEGLTRGERVVISGQLKLDNNSSVRLEDDAAQAQ